MTRTWFRHRIVWIVLLAGLMGAVSWLTLPQSQEDLPEILHHPLADVIPLYSQYSPKTDAPKVVRVYHMASSLPEPSGFPYRCWHNGSAGRCRHSVGQ